MMKQFTAAATAAMWIALAGCASGPVVNHTALQNGSHKISVQAETADAAAAQLSSLEKKAAQVCGGSGYMVEGKQGPARQAIPTYVDGVQVDVISYLLTLTVRCKG